MGYLARNVVPLRVSLSGKPYPFDRVVQDVSLRGPETRSPSRGVRGKHIALSAWQGVSFGTLRSDKPANLIAITSNTFPPFHREALA